MVSNRLNRSDDIERVNGMKTIKQKSMSFSAGFFGAPYENPEGSRQVDWNKAKQFIEENKERLEDVEVGLAEDWDCTYSELWTKENGYKNAGYLQFYGASTWATPAITVTYLDGTEETFECWEYGEDHYFKNLNKI